MKLTGENRSTRGKTCPSAPLSTTDPIWTEAGSRPVLRGKRSVTNRLCYGTIVRPEQCSQLSSSLCLSCVDI
jgi:hypothetical protein